MDEIYNLLSEEDLTPDLKMIADVCGTESVTKMIKNLSGLSFYIPKLSHFDSLVLKYAKSKPEKTMKQLATELNVSLPYIRKIMKAG